MTLKKASAFRSIGRPYTRKSRVKGKGYIKTIPQKKIVKFSMGEAKKFYEGGFSIIVSLISEENRQIRDNALESARTLVHKMLEEKIGKDYFFTLALHPHQILREHAQAAVAQADRIFQGMAMSFGKPVGLASQVKEGKDIFVIAINKKEDIAKVREIFDSVRTKIGCRSRVEVKEKEKIALIA